MPIISTSFNDVGNAGQVPSLVRIETDDTLAAVLTVGYLNVLAHQYLPLNETSVVLVSTGVGVNKAVSAMRMVFSSGDWSLEILEGYQESLDDLTLPTATVESADKVLIQDVSDSDKLKTVTAQSIADLGGGGGGVILPTTPNHIAVYADVDGLLYQDAATIINDGNITAYGVLTAGNSAGGQAGEVYSYPNAAASGFINIQAINVSGGDHSSTLRNNAGLLQDTIYSFPVTSQNAPVLAVVDSAGTPTSGHLAVWSTTKGTLVDGGVVPTAGMTWSNIAGTTQAAAVNTGYIVGNASQTTVTLPVTAAIGAIVAVKGKGAAGWILAAGVGQTIQVGQSATSSGGTVTSANNFDCIQVTCITANTTWSVDYVLSTGVTIA